jgi:hypothetical protein
MAPKLVCFQDEDVLSRFNDDVTRIAEDDLRFDLQPLLAWLTAHQKLLKFEELKV